MINQINNLIDTFLDAHPLIRIVSVILLFIVSLAVIIYINFDKPTPMKQALVRIKKERKAARKNSNLVEGAFFYDSETYHNR